MIKYLQLPTCKLAEFAAEADTSFTVSGFLYNDGVTPVDPSDIGDICYATLEPKTAREELISFTIVSVTAAGVATITATRGLLQKSPYTTGGAAFDHQNGSDLVISNNPGLFNQLTAKDNAEVITEQWTFPEPTANNSPATKAYADSLVIMGGAEATDTTRGQVILSESPALAIGTCTVSIATPAVVSFVAHGLVEGDSIKLTTTGALPTGLTAATTYFVMSAGLTANAFQVSLTLGGAAIDTTGSQSGVHTLTKWTPVGVGYNDTTKLPTVNEKLAMAGGGDFGAPDADNQFITEEYLSSASGLPIVRQYISKTFGSSTTRFDITEPVTDTIRYTWDATGTDPEITEDAVPRGTMLVVNGQNFNAANNGTFKVTGVGANYFEVNNASGVVESDKTLGTGSIIPATTWSKPTGLKYVTVEGVGGGGGADTDDEQSGSGGGYFRKLIPVSALGATETVTVGARGGNSTGTPTAGGATSFGSHCTANGGGAQGDVGGTATGGDINIQGQTGESGSSGTGGNYPIAGASILGLAGISANASTGYGVGGTAAISNSDEPKPGIVIVTEYYS